MQQNSIEWYRARLGNFTGSKIGDLMSSGKKKDAMFGKTAMSYIYEVASERDLLSAYLEDDYLFEIYQNLVSVNTKYMEYGHENEELAAETYAEVNGCVLELCESVTHPSIPHFSASPDRIAVWNDGAKINRKIVEIKCPMPKTFMLYKNEVNDGQSLLEVEPKYFYQVQAEMACTGLSSADFVVFCPFLKHNIHIVEIQRDDDVIYRMSERINMANELIEKLLNNKIHEFTRKRRPA